MAREDLIPLDKRTKEEQKKITSMGGIQSGIIRRKKRDLKKRIASAWELATDMKEKELIININDCIKKGVLEDDPKIQLLRDKVKMLGVGGVEMLTLMEVISNPKTSALTKTIAIDNLFAHEFGKPKRNDTLKIEWGSGMGKSPAFSDESIILGIKHGIEKLKTGVLGEVIEMIKHEQDSRLVLAERLHNE